MVNRHSVGVALCLLPLAAWPLQPGRYVIEVEAQLPNVARVAAPQVFEVCLDQLDFESGAAYVPRWPSPIQRCALRLGEHDAQHAITYIECAGPNAASAKGWFEATPSGFQGRYSMQMGGKNMTMSETQHARLVEARASCAVAR